MKSSRSRVENQRFQPRYDVECGSRTKVTLEESECCHHCAILVITFDKRAAAECMQLVRETSYLFFEEDEEDNGKTNDENDKNNKHLEYCLGDFHEHGDINSKQTKPAEKQHQVGITEENRCHSH